MTKAERTTRTLYPAIGCLALALSSLLAPARAQDAVPAAPGTKKPVAERSRSAGQGALEEVVVTARRRSERIQKVPLAVTALTAATLRQQSINTVYDLPRAAPSLNVNISSSAGQNTPQLTIRGQRQGDSKPSLDPSVGVYFGDIVAERPFGFAQSFFDLSNIQVLKGPQGTLFGRNTTGGAILLQPNLPTDQYSGSIHTSLGSYNLHEVDGFLNIPISDHVELRVAGQHTDRDGYIHDVTNGQYDESENESAIRASLRLKLSDDLENVTVGNYISRDTDGTGYKIIGASAASAVGQIYGPGGPAAVAQSQRLGFYDIATDTARGYAHLRTSTIANTTTYHLNDAITLKNIVGYMHYNSSAFDDEDGSPLPIVGFGAAQQGDQFTEEAQVLGKARNLNWIFGGYFFREGVAYESDTPEELNPVLVGTRIPQIIRERDANESKSVFGSGTYDFSDYVPHVSATFGGRYTWDTRDARFGTLYGVGFVPGQIVPLGFPSPGASCGFATSPTPVVYQPYPSCAVHRTAGFEQFTYNVDLDYNITPDKLVYFAHRLGYRTGGFGTPAVFGAQLAPFQPETVNDYELGAKLEWHFNGMFLRTNFAAYKQDYVNIQRLVPFEANGVTQTNIQNAASASIDGAEFEFLFSPGYGLDISGFLSQTQPSYNVFDVQLPSGAKQDISQTAPFAGFPRTTFGITGRYTLPTPEAYGAAVLQVNYYHQSAFITNDSAVQEPFGDVQAYGLLNLRAEWNGLMGSKFDLAAFVNNALDKKYSAANFSLINEVGFASSVPGPPLMFGFGAKYHFGI